jgi:hypothetical protein
MDQIDALIEAWLAENPDVLDTMVAMDAASPDSPCGAVMAALMIAYGSKKHFH